MNKMLNEGKNSINGDLGTDDDSHNSMIPQHCSPRRHAKKSKVHPTSSSYHDGNYDCIIKKKPALPRANPTINDLPNGVISQVAEYLPNPTRVLLAVALAAPSSSWCKVGGSTASEISKSIVPSLEELDFEDIEEEAAKKLTDDDLAACLICIDAKNTIKSLKFANCYNIVGHGLDPLRGSKTLERIDLSLEKKNGPQKFDEKIVKLEKSVVLTFLMSIVDIDDAFAMNVDGTSLQQVYLSPRWEEAQEVDEDSYDFYNRPWAEFWFIFRRRILTNGAYRCPVENCDKDIYESDFWKTCYDCISLHCGSCSGDTPEDHERRNGAPCSIFECSVCIKKKCKDCLPQSEAYECGNCGGSSCKSCADVKACQDCGIEKCAICFTECQGCNKVNCIDCGDEKENNSAHFCPECKGLCPDCLKEELCKGGCEDLCDACKGRAVPNLIKRLDRSYQEIKELKEMRS